MGKGNRQRKYSRDQGPHIPGQEKAGAPEVETTQVVVQAQQIVKTGQSALEVFGGRDDAHRQMMLFRGLEVVARRTMMFAQRVQDLMKEDEEISTKIVDYLVLREEQDAEQRQQAESQILSPNGNDIAESDKAKTGG